MSFRSIVLATAIFAFAAPLAAQQPAPTPTPTPTAEVAKVKKPRPICRQLGQTGSHFVKQVCHSAQEWAAIDAEQTGAPQRNSSGNYGN